MASIQRLRARAVASGALVSAPQQQVVYQDGDIEIVPSQPDAIYVPSYDPDVVYSDGPLHGIRRPLHQLRARLPCGGLAGVLL